MIKLSYLAAAFLLVENGHDNPYIPKKLSDISNQTKTAQKEVVGGCVIHLESQLIPRFLSFGIIFL